MIQYLNEDCQQGIKKIADSSIDIILTDPPYLYLKGQKLEREFDEKGLFNEWYRVLKPGGFIVLFGRGTSFYRWNYLLSEIGFDFKEEIIWNKRMNTLPGLNLQRYHETVSIHVKGKNSINKCKVPYLEKKQFDLVSLTNDIKRISSALGSSELEDMKRFVETGNIIYSGKKTEKVFFKNAHGERSRGAGTLKSIKEGMCEGSIMEVLREHYKSIHPTQKPVKLLKRLLALVVPKSDNVKVLDPFAGSASGAEACHEMGLNFIGFEIDEEYYQGGKKRIDDFAKIGVQSELFKS